FTTIKFLNNLNNQIRNSVHVQIQKSFTQQYDKQLALRHNYFQKNELPIFKNILAFSLMGFLSGAEKELNPEEEIVMTMKRAIICVQREQYSQAEQLLHIALNMAQKQNNQNAITYIYDLMANLAMERNEPMKAKNLFVNVMQRLLQSGIEEGDLKVVHISLKVANVHVQMGYLEEAEIGYVWCIDKLEHKTDNDSLLLRGISYDYYAQLLLTQNRVKKAIDCLKSAYDICVQVLGITSNQSIKLLNDLGSAYWRAGDLSNAESYFKKSLSLIQISGNESYTGVLKYNLGTLLMEKGLYKDSQQMCKEAWHFAKASNDNNLLERASDCLDNVKSKINSK
ncbi:tetratricopeptide repeat protein 19 homolog, mitochondrial-like, partial [Chrysoperla carnea]|uniref:tetratricopeptide repeat protein 19 homolog, mitochondrial-like n=1 Tax=Chrysoperla carnea TaxID=189513 RepID=UPI001D083ABE